MSIHFRGRKSFVLSCVTLVSAMLIARTELSAQNGARTTIRLPSFSSIHVPGNAHVVLRPAAFQRVTLVSGNLSYSRIAVTDAGVLVIDKCRRKCPPDYELEIEIDLPSIAMLSVADGGWIRSEGRFSRQNEIEIDVSNGGTIDVRSMPADRVIASIDQGGQIRTIAGVTLSAKVTHGGAVTYWGNARVKSSIEDGGCVSKGSADEIDAPPVDDGAQAI